MDEVLLKAGVGWSGIARQHVPGSAAANRSNPLPEKRRVAETAAGPHRVVRHDADALPAAALVQPFGVAARGIEHQQCAPARLRLSLRAFHQSRAEAVLARRAMHQQLLDVAAMRLVWRHVEAELHGADDAAAELCGHQNGFADRKS